MKTILSGCALALLAPATVLAQGLGVGSLGSGLGASLSPGAGAGASISAGTGVASSLDPGPGMGANLGAQPGSIVSPGVSAAQAGADASANTTVTRGGAPRAAATADLRVGTTIRDSTGAVLGRVVRLVQAAPGSPAGVVVILDGRSYTLPQTSFSVSGQALIYSGAALR